MKHWVDYIRDTEYTAHEAVNERGSEIDFTNLVLILHFLKICS